jgi:hypothetical protein
MSCSVVHTLDIWTLSPLVMGRADFSLPFKGRDGVGMGQPALDEPIPLPPSPLKGEE